MNIMSTNVTFEIVRPLNNEGKNSTVYLAHDYQLNTDLVVKKVPINEIVKSEDDFRPDFIFNESRMLFNNNHPNVMKIQYGSFDENNIYFSMPYCKKGSLNALIDTRFLTIHEVIKYSLDFLSGLHYIHTNKLAHFDIKPTNIVIGDNNKAILTDFGLAKYLDIYGLEKLEKVYTLHYPPEGILYDKVSNLSDVYQAGVTLYRLCNGNKHFKNQAKQYSSEAELYTNIVKGNFPNRDFYLPHVPKKLRTIINRAMNVNLNKRYSTVLDMMNDISSIEENIDWIYNNSNDDDIESWSTLNKNKTHLIKIILKPINNKYIISGKKIRISDNKSTNIPDYAMKGIGSISEAYKIIGNLVK